MLAIRKGYGRRSIPWLHEHAMIFVKCFLFLRHMRIFRPRFRNEHHRRMCRFTPGKHEEFKCIIKNRGITAVYIQNRQDLLQVIPECFRNKLLLTCFHPIHIASKRIDFTIMDQVTVWMCPFPARKSIRTEAGMH
ncbi:hypothetical protein SRABI80_04009 [Peribacillus frigoritolerans]|nr:hypothetical protein SRABI80_04009 [Peribacillus frigoritolerans]